LEKEPQSFAGDAILRVIEVNTGGFCLHAFAALRVLCEKLTEVQVADLFIVGF
jgi:hypothetical protein